MRWPIGPVVVSPATTGVQLPANATLMRGCALFNNSQYLLKVGTQQDWLQPFSAGWFDASVFSGNQLPLQALPFGSQVNAATGQILTGTFYDNEEAVPYLEPFAADPITTAEALAASGVPNVLRSTLLAAFNPFLSGTSFTLNNLSQYASLIIQLSGTQANIRCDYHQEDPFVPGNFLTEESYTNIAGDLFVASWQVPLTGGSADVKNVSVNSAGLSIYGTNRAVSQPRQLGLSNLTRLLTFNGAGVAGADSPLVAGDGAITRATTFNGVCTWQCTPTAAGLLRASYVDKSNTVQTFTIVNAPLAANTTALGTFAHPMCPVYWSFRPSASGAAVVPFYITQN